MLRVLNIHLHCYSKVVLASEIEKKVMNSQNDKKMDRCTETLQALPQNKTTGIKLQKISLMIKKKAF